MRETSASESLAKHRKRIQMTSKPGPHPSSGKSMAGTYVLAMRCPVLRRRDSHSGSCTELENLDGDGKGKGHEVRLVGKWTAPRASPTNSVFLLPEAFDYFVDEARSVRRAVKLRQTSL